MGPDCCASCTAEDSDSSLGSLDSRVSLSLPRYLLAAILLQLPLVLIRDL